MKMICGTFRLGTAVLQYDNKKQKKQKTNPCHKLKSSATHEVICAVVQSKLHVVSLLLLKAVKQFSSHFKSKLS